MTKQSRLQRSTSKRKTTDMYGHDIEEKLGRELTNAEIQQLRNRVDHANPPIVLVAHQLELDLQSA